MDCRCEGEREVPRTKVAMARAGGTAACRGKGGWLGPALSHSGALSLSAGSPHLSACGDWMHSSQARDLITVTALSLRSSHLGVDHWQRSNKEQPLLCTLRIHTDVSDEAQVDNLLANSLNYGTVTKTVEQAVADYGRTTSSDEVELEILAEYLAKAVIFTAHAPNVQLELSRPRALLTADAVGVEIYRSRADYSRSPSSPQDYSLQLSSVNRLEDRLFVRGLRRLIIIGLNACELVDEQEVECDFDFFADPMEHLMKSGARAGWQGWKQAVKRVEAVSSPLCKGWT